MKQKELKNILTKEPFKRIAPSISASEYAIDNPSVIEAKPTWVAVPQSEFLREYYPSGHKINDPLYYPDKIHVEEDDEGRKRYYTEKMIRCAFPFQSIIATKQIIHVCGNDIHFELTSPQETEADKMLFFQMKKGWHIKHSEEAFYQGVKSIKVVGDGAIVGIIKKNKFFWKTLSYLNGDTLYPHYNDVGELELFARKFETYDEEGNARVSYVEVWDNKKYYLFKKDKGDTLVSKILEKVGIRGYRPVGEPVNHGFNKVPVAYHRDPNGPCWSNSQDLIDKYELAVSHLSQNNLAYAFPIMFLKGESIEIQGGEDMYRPAKAIVGDASSQAEFLNTPNGSEHFKLQLEVLLDNIFRGSFTVLPPEIRSGDLPGVAIKLLYSPALEKAMADAAELDMFLAKMVDIFTFGYGLEVGKLTAMSNLPVNAWIEPYIHQNTAELIANLQQSVFGGFLSVETASELTPYAKNDEFYRLMKQTANAEQADILNEVDNDRQRESEAIRQEEDSTTPKTQEPS